MVKYSFVFAVSLWANNAELNMIAISSVQILRSILSSLLIKDSANFPYTARCECGKLPFEQGGELSFHTRSYGLYKHSFDVYGVFPESIHFAYRSNGTYEKVGSFR